MVSFGLPSHQIVPEIVSQIRAPLDLILDLAQIASKTGKRRRRTKEDRKAYFLDRYIYIISNSRFGLSYHVSVDDSRYIQKQYQNVEAAVAGYTSTSYLPISKQAGCSALSPFPLTIPIFMNQGSVLQGHRVKYLHNR